MSIDRITLHAALIKRVPYNQVTQSHRSDAKCALYFHLYAPGGGFPMVTQHQIEAALSREEIVAALEGTYSIQCYDHECKAELADALAEAMNTEGDKL